MGRKTVTEHGGQVGGCLNTSECFGAEDRSIFILFLGLRLAVWHCSDI